jgi:hypothetical protein
MEARKHLHEAGIVMLIPEIVFMMVIFACMEGF